MDRGVLVGPKQSIHGKLLGVPTIGGDLLLVQIIKQILLLKIPQIRASASKSVVPHFPLLYLGCYCKKGAMILYIAACLSFLPHSSYIWLTEEQVVPS